jgi:hypothetical protein
MMRAAAIPAAKATRLTVFMMHLLGNLPRESLVQRKAIRRPEQGTETFHP